jgi:hypothetical protein
MLRHVLSVSAAGTIGTTATVGRFEQDTSAATITCFDLILSGCHRKAPRLPMPREKILKVPRKILN